MLGIKRSSQLTLFILCLRNTLYWYIVSIVRFVWYFNWQVWNIPSQSRKVFIGSMCISIIEIFLLNSLYLLTLLKRPSQWRAKPIKASYIKCLLYSIKKGKKHPQKGPSVIANLKKRKIKQIEAWKAFSCDPMISLLYAHSFCKGLLQILGQMVNITDGTGLILSLNEDKTHV